MPAFPPRYAPGTWAYSNNSGRNFVLKLDSVFAFALA